MRGQAPDIAAARLIRATGSFSSRHPEDSARKRRASRMEQGSLFIRRIRLRPRPRLRPFRTR